MYVLWAISRLFFEHYQKENAKAGKRNIGEKGGGKIYILSWPLARLWMSSLDFYFGIGFSISVSVSVSLFLSLSVSPFLSVPVCSCLCLFLSVSIQPITNVVGR